MPASQQTVRLHAWQLTILGVEVNGRPAKFSTGKLVPEPFPPHLETGDLKENIPQIAQLASEQYHQYLAHRANPQVLITLPEGRVRNGEGHPGSSNLQTNGRAASGEGPGEELVDVTIRVRKEPRGWGAGVRSERQCVPLKIVK